MEGKKEFGEGAFFSIGNHIYALLMTNLYFIICNILFLFFFIGLKPSFSNLLIYFLALIPSGPAISALFYSVGKLLRKKEISPSKDFFKGYKRNFKDTMKFWLPLLLVSYILLVDLQYFISKSGMAYLLLSIVFAAGIILLFACSLYLFMVNVDFKFRTRDLWKLSAYYLFIRAKITFGNIGIIIVALFICYISSFLLLLLLVSLVCFLFAMNSRPVLEDIQSNFVRSEPMDH